MRMSSITEEAVLGFIERVYELEQRLDDRIRLKFHANVQENELLFMEFILKKRPENYMVVSTEETFHITRGDIDAIKKAIKAVLPTDVVSCQLDFTIYKKDQQNIFDLHTKVAGVLSTSTKSTAKCRVYENIESSIKLSLGDTFEVSPAYTNRHIGFGQYDKFTIRVS